MVGRARVERVLETREVKRVLVAVDGSDDSLRAAGVAISIAKRFGAELIVCHVIPTPVYSSTQVGTSNLANVLNVYFEAARKDAKNMVDEVARLAASVDVKAVSVIQENVFSIVEAIVSLAEKRKVDLIVMGTRGQSGFKKLLMGSVSSGVITHAHCSVLVVR